MSSVKLLLILAAAAAAPAQQRELGILAGGGLVNAVPLGGAAGSVTAGLSPGAAAGVLIGHDLYPRLSGEIRYLFEQRDPKLTSGSTTASFSGQAHVLHYDVLLHARPRRERVRPYAALGGGIKVFRGTGAETAYRPLMQYAYLTRTQELKPMLSAGGGVKFRLSARMVAHVDLRDQLTRFPDKVLTPGPAADRRARSEGPLVLCRASSRAPRSRRGREGSGRRP